MTSCIRARAVALVCVVAAALAGCPDETVAPVDEACLTEGRCECLTVADCAPGQVCVSGQCVFQVQPTEDVVEETVTPDVTVDTVDTAEDVEEDIGEGELGWPCETDSQCNSNKCIAGPEGTNVCTKTCIEECPNGWACKGISGGGSIVTFYCLPKRERLCEPCVGDSTCPGAENLCVTVGDSQRCGIACADADCPTGYSCQEVTSVDGVTAEQCVPDSGFCQCTVDNVGALIPCTVDNEFGTCFGEQECQEGGVLGACTAKTPAAETCNGEDDDCNGFPDDNVPPVACTKDNEFGECGGQTLCLVEVGEICNAPEPGVEACDQLDNDCDGATDEDFKNAEGQYDQLGHCGQCGFSCVGAFAHADEVVCDTTGGADGTQEPFCRVETCETGYVKASDQLCVQPADHLCEPCTTNASCGGAFDECYQVDPFDTRKFCLRNCAPGNIYGEDCPTGYTCQELDLGGTLVQQCVPDNNSCDCLDSNAGQTKPCSQVNQYGQCFGVSTCDPAQGWSGCTALEPAEEVCDGVDNNCNGIIDENLGGKPCDNTNAFGTCTGTEICDPVAGTLTCAAPDAAEDVCDGIDNDCDGETDEDYAENITDGSGNVVALKYSLTDDNCGGCGIACTANPPASEVSCDGSGQQVVCRIDACEPGYYNSGGKACLPVPAANLCLPCAGDGDCQGPGDACLAYGEGSFCGRDCTEGSIYSTGDAGDPGYCTGTEGEQGCCPAGYLCTSGQCQRESGACSCNADGKVRPCQVTNGFGTCQGVETCQTTGAGAGWQACNAATPAQEVCDGVDNDCDGLVDQADPDIDTAGLTGYPGCENVSSACSGSWACANVSGTVQWVCSAPQAGTEVCNAKDDDCDGEIDEDFTDGSGAYTLLEHCGQCGLDCNTAIANLAGSAGDVTCELVGGTPRCVPQACAPGYAPFPATGTAAVCIALSAKNCQPCVSDAECGFAGDKCVSVGSDDGTFCAQRCDAAAPYAGCTGAAGAQGCCPSGFTCEDVGGDMVCQPSSGTCQCSALSDGLTRVCNATAGGNTCFGTETCGDLGGGVYGWEACDLSANVEVCDGVDNDCDGTTDEGYQSGGVYGTDENCGQCGKNCALAFSAEQQHVFGVCDAGVPGGPDCVVGGCLTDSVGGGTACTSDADCAGNPAGTTCLPDRFQCGQTCNGDGDCPGAGICRNSTCTTSCSSDGQCTSAYGPTSSCQGGACMTDYTWVDLDTLPGNGCECAVAGGSGLDTPEIFADYPVVGDTYVDRNCDGIDGDAATAIFVRAGSSGNGSLANPFGTIQAAIDAFGGSDTHILVASGVYDERIVLKNGVELYGGYSADFQVRDVILFPTVIAGPEPNFGASVTPGTVNAEGITQFTVVAGFEIRGYDVTTTGETSYGVYVAGSSNQLRIVNNRIIGGKGGPGAAGSAGAIGQSGGQGGDGLDATECSNQSCSGNSQVGGAIGTNSACNSVARGCIGMESDGNESPQVKDNPNPVSGCTYANGGDSGNYGGGGSQYCKYDYNPPNVLNGPNGSDGSSGSSGNGGNGCNDADGSVSGGEWSPAGGGAGSGGSAGTGGQGGSAGSYAQNSKNASVCTIANPVGDLGGSGGGGGAGGCGGTGGASGGTGGGSFAVFIASQSGSSPYVRDNIVTRGVGGAGGPGGNGGSGGPGGLGGLGGIASWPSWGAGNGGYGGRGGDGGAGGGGGGGCGGPSYGVATIGIGTSQYSNNNDFTVPGGTATGGPGGAGGLSPASGGNGSAGAQGASANVKQY